MTLCCEFPLYVDKIDVKAEINCITQTAKTNVKMTLHSMFSPDQKIAPSDLAFVIIVPSLNGIMSDVNVNYLEKSDVHPSCYATSLENVKSLSPTHMQLIRKKNTKNLTPIFLLTGEIAGYDAYSSITLSYTIDHPLVQLPSNSLTFYSLGRDLMRDTRFFEMEMVIYSKEKVGNIKFTLPMISSFTSVKTDQLYKTTLHRFKLSPQTDLELLKKKDMNTYIYTDMTGDFIAQYNNGLFLQMNITKGLSEFREKYLSIVIDLTLQKEELQWCKAYLIGLLILCETRNSLSGLNVYTVQSTTTSCSIFQLNNQYFSNPTHEDFKSAINFIEELTPSKTESITDVVITQFIPFELTTDVVFATQSRTTTLYMSEKFKTHYIFCGELLNLYSAWCLNTCNRYFDLVGPNRLSDLERGIWGLYSAIVARKLSLTKMEIEYENMEETLDILDLGSSQSTPSFTYIDGGVVKLFFPMNKKIKAPIKVHSLFRNEEFGTEEVEDKIIDMEMEFNEDQSFISEYNQLHAMGSKELLVMATEHRVASTYSILDSSPTVCCYFSYSQSKPLPKKIPTAELQLISSRTPIDNPKPEQGDYEPDDKIKHFITSTLNKLSEMTFAGVVTDLLTIDYSNSCVITYLAKTIVNKASRDLKYIPFYADLCVSLSIFISSNFTQTLLNLLNIEFNVRNISESYLLSKSNSLSPEVIQRILSQSHIRFSAIIRFIGHLNLRGFVPSYFMITVIRELLKDCTDQSFEYLNLLLRIIGEVWDSSSDISFMMDEVFETIEYTLSHPQGICNRTKFMLMDLIDLRDLNWAKQTKKPPSLAKPGESFDPSMQTIDEEAQLNETEGSFIDDA
ncbi:MIF4G domain containing protein [Entamoeba histolytica HM-1:IMSS-B]|uniref:MIF4G domain-containing protein n=6 Tax=Entamoeba histolytica TaxID=5759 RepID=C4M0P0_ENTH1|nr:hypothetical protein EHI_008760 [Entamoeba histolytica HM-1:IMSS]EMD45649.1 MIF4G domain containing protein [Entamoeba histolytica KU27]EMH75382.1 MIF4G domain containing protein [Entamoeba histolytica HM-1:IMSS-B]EMS11444.1 MIF4G domain containing protein [Entamoeba histolytica HM-3:IMSS]ENY65174.1 MIF4G domain containing protein [Entamoeba histolytica HM-1:IMSS-A]GAT94736.1 hypothetical protein CL6EHI_008760 [Entamoeba histolytica]|eukprot:XP_652976.1 hypothetical protein EHI_008760 [Entamoeba histolytica HM-1:IMSS]